MDHTVGPTATQTGEWEDILRPGLEVVFVGFNPSLPAWRTGHYYANPGNRFYQLLFESGLTPRLLLPSEDRTLPGHGIGATDILHIPSARADQIAPETFRAARFDLFEKLRAAAPRVICLNGMGVFCHLFGYNASKPGFVPNEHIGNSAVFVVPSTSGLANGHAAKRLAAFRELAAWLGRGTDRQTAESPDSSSQRHS